MCEWGYCAVYWVVVSNSNDTVAFESAQRQIEHPQTEEENRGDYAPFDRSAEFAADGAQATHHHHKDGYDGERAEHGDGEGERARHHPESRAVVGVIGGCEEPGQADAEENVDRVRAGHIAY